MHLVDSDYVRLVCPWAVKMHTSATRCAENLNLTEKKSPKMGVAKEAPYSIYNWSQFGDKKM